MLRAAPAGDAAWCGPSQKDADPANDPSKASAWGPERSIRGPLIRWLCIDREGREYVDPRGLQIHGARVEGPLELSFVRVCFPLSMNCCSLKDEIRLRFLRIPTISFNGSWVRSINGECAKVKGTVALGNGFSSEGATGGGANREQSGLRGRTLPKFSRESAARGPDWRAGQRISTECVPGGRGGPTIRSGDWRKPGVQRRHFPKCHRESLERGPCERARQCVLTGWVFGGRRSAPGWCASGRQSGV